MRICIDLDGTICETRRMGQDYANVEPKPGAVDFIKKLNEEGHYVIIHTARGMKTFKGNKKKIEKTHYHCITEWFQRHGIKYDELIFGKPLADVYIDDRAMVYDNNWKELNAILPRHG